MDMLLGSTGRSRLEGTQRNRIITSLPQMNPIKRFALWYDSPLEMSDFMKTGAAIYASAHRDYLRERARILAGQHICWSEGFLRGYLAAHRGTIRYLANYAPAFRPMIAQAIRRERRRMRATKTVDAIRL
jgi:hypothetical protein